MLLRRNDFVLFQLEYLLVKFKYIYIYIYIYIYKNKYTNQNLEKE